MLLLKSLYKHFLLIGMTLFFIMYLVACSTNNDFGGAVEVPTFSFPETHFFEDSLSDYGVYQANMADLQPSEDYHFLELSAVLFTDYAHKQRLVKVPVGAQITKNTDGSLNFPDGTILVKTFYYYNDERDTTLGKRIIESRLLIKQSGMWNIATYIWNDTQDAAILSHDGVDKPLSWIDENGQQLSTAYHIPSQNECMTCHQEDGALATIGPSLRNLNKTVSRNSTLVNQLIHLQALGVLSNFDTNDIGTIVDYKDSSQPLVERGRAYLDLNCAHCHSPGRWDEPASKQFDLRYETPLGDSGIPFEKDRIRDVVVDGEMPFIGTTMIDQEGVNLLIEYLESI